MAAQSEASSNLRFSSYWARMFRSVIRQRSKYYTKQMTGFTEQFCMWVHTREDLWGLLLQLIGKSSLRYNSGTFLSMTSSIRRQSRWSLLMAKLFHTRNLRRSADLVSYTREVIMWTDLFWYFWILLASPLFRLPQTALQWSKTGSIKEP